MARKCIKCKEEKSATGFIAVKSDLHDGALPICRECLMKMILKEEQKTGTTWNIVDRLCQWAGVPFIPEEWEKFYENNKEDGFGMYMSVFRNEEYETLDWGQYNRVYLQIRDEGRVEDALPEVQEARIKQLKQKWGHHYDIEELEYLENLHIGMLNSQNIVGALNEDQALKLCKISLVIEDKIRAGQDFSKDLKAYDDLAKLANLTPKIIKDANDFSSVGEIFAYLEKKGWVNQYYDDVVRDEVDFTIMDVKQWLRYLYVNETGVAEEIEQRIENLKISDQLSNRKFDEAAFRDYMQEQSGFIGENEEFEVDL